MHLHPPKVTPHHSPQPSPSDSLVPACLPRVRGSGGVVAKIALRSSVSSSEGKGGSAVAYVPNPPPGLLVVRPDPEVEKASERWEGWSTHIDGRPRGLSSEEAGNIFPGKLRMAGPLYAVPNVGGHVLPVTVPA